MSINKSLRLANQIVERLRLLKFGVTLVKLVRVSFDDDGTLSKQEEK